MWLQYSALVKRLEPKSLGILMIWLPRSMRATNSSSIFLYKIRCLWCWCWLPDVRASSPNTPINLRPFCRHTSPGMKGEQPSPKSSMAQRTPQANCLTPIPDSQAMWCIMITNPRKRTTSFLAPTRISRCSISDQA